MTKGASNAGYAEEVDALFERYESRDPAAIHAPWAHLLPAEPARIIDIGAGTGRDAAWFASLGHQVLAVEPTTALRERAAILHPEPNIEWLDDILPGIPHVLAREETYDLILMHAVWMHLTEQERMDGMANLARLLAPGGRIAMSQRHGPVPQGRRMLDVTGEETIALAAKYGLINLFNQRAGSIQAENRANHIEWTKLVFEKT